MTQNLKTYSLANAPHVTNRSKFWKVVIQPHNNAILINEDLYADMGEPDKIVVLQDLDKPHTFFLKASNDPQAFPVTRIDDKHLPMIVSSTLITKKH